MATEIAYAGENTLDALVRAIKMAIAESAFPDDPGEIVFGTDKHDELKNRDLPDQHPIEAITDLAAALEGIGVNTRAINTLREGNLIDHNAIRTSITNLTEDVGALSGIPEDVEKFKMEVEGNLGKANEAIQKNAEDIKALQKPEGGGGMSVPSGIICMWSGSEVPDGWALCDGQNGTPDLRGCFVFGATSLSDIGQTGGSSKVTLSVQQIPSHYHNQRISDGSYSLYELTGQRGDVNGYAPISIMAKTGAQVTTSQTGGNQPHENMPPYYTLAYIMKL